METYYRMVGGELADVSLQLYQQHENLERELTQLRAENQALKEKLSKEHKVRLTFEELHRQQSLKIYGANG